MSSLRQVDISLSRDDFRKGTVRMWRALVKAEIHVLDRLKRALVSRIVRDNTNVSSGCSGTAGRHITPVGMELVSAEKALIEWRFLLMD